MDAGQIAEAGRAWIPWSEEALALVWTLLLALSLTSGLFYALEGRRWFESTSRALCAAAAACAAFLALSAVVGSAAVQKEAIDKAWGEASLKPYIQSLPEKKEKIEGIDIYKKNADGTAEGTIYYRSQKGKLETLSGVFSLEKGERDELSYKLLEKGPVSGVEAGKYMAKISIASVVPNENKKTLKELTSKELLPFPEIGIFKYGAKTSGLLTGSLSLLVFASLLCAAFLARKAEAREAQRRASRTETSREEAEWLCAPHLEAEAQAPESSKRGAKRVVRS